MRKKNKDQNLKMPNFQKKKKAREREAKKTRDQVLYVYIDHCNQPVILYKDTWTHGSQVLNLPKENEKHEMKCEDSDDSVSVDTENAQEEEKEEDREEEEEDQEVI